MNGSRMSASSTPDLHLEPEDSVKKVRQKVHSFSSLFYICSKSWTEYTIFWYILANLNGLVWWIVPRFSACPIFRPNMAIKFSLNFSPNTKSLPQTSENVQKMLLNQNSKSFLFSDKKRHFLFNSHLHRLTKKWNKK